VSRRILLVDDDPAILRGLSGLLRDEGYGTETAATAAEAHEAMSKREPPAAMILDLGLPDESGLALLARLPRPLPAPVVVLSGGATPGEAAQALKLGATDFVEKPPTAERILTALQNALALRDLEDERQRLREELAQPGNLIGESAAMSGLRKLVARAGPSDSVVLVQGETGTGKERVARALHLGSGRKGRFVAVNCAAIPAQLLESELFGAERGAFTGATARRIGRFEQAQCGTLLLDEIGELPLELQAKLLRVLEQREVERLGGTAPVRVDVRVVAATNINLMHKVEDGKFREDLYYRLSTVPIYVPPLRERGKDVELLFRKFATDFAEKYKVKPISLTDDAKEVLLKYRFPGNIRQLKNLVEQISVLSSDNKEISVESLQRYLPKANTLPALYKTAGGEKENLSERDIRNVHVASLLHDVGKIGIDDAIRAPPVDLPGGTGGRYRRGSVFHLQPQRRKPCRARI